MKNNVPTYVLTFEWHSLFRDLVRNVWLMLLSGLVAFMGIYIAQRSAYSPLYTSSATLAVRIKSATNSALDNLAVSADTAGIYAAVFEGASMKALAAENLGLEEFPGTVTTAVVSGLNLMQLSVTAEDPELAYHLLNSILTVYPQISDAIFSNAVIDTMVTPQMPEAPSNQLSRTYRVVLILLAMMLEGAMIVLLSLLRETVKHERAFAQMIEGRLLGTITHERPHQPRRDRLLRRKKALLIDSAYSTFRFSEDYRRLATKLEYLKKRQNASVFVVTSVAENEGKSTVTANLALALAERGYRVAVMDLDLHNPSLYKVMECREELAQDFSDVLSGKLAVQDYHFWQYKRGIVVALNQHYRRDAAEQLDSERMREALLTMREKMDFVLLDAPPAAVSADAAGLARMADRTLMVVRCDHAAVKDINDTILTLTNVGGNLAGCILNDVYKPFTFWGQMGADEDSAYASSYQTGKRYESRDSEEMAYRTTNGDGLNL